MIHLVYTFEPTEYARANMTEFWEWIRERQDWFYNGIEEVLCTRWYVCTVGANVHSIEHHVSFADEASWGSYRAELKRRSNDKEWEARRCEQEKWWYIRDARLLGDAPVPSIGYDQDS
ncbi:hypothetical protein FHX37_0432 [Haloactinospora alba]|uniref:NIPSNAP protein n=1 Tax=Haloactinospora alba TaxID=405555 RepID=A0A543NFF4_9ACTN|nr:hypothetical protein [Haloactinospora alba]TQN30551.1 hypothetical protein FHX37_0432 [Haloactinospora alba]